MNRENKFHIVNIILTISVLVLMFKSHNNNDISNTFFFGIAGIMFSVTGITRIKMKNRALQLEDKE